ncbi:unnamed protein product [Schistocephalus solidus]|uniref:IRS-type PTB domain-containing protein n=1 Tax=Schistocephalus solidus TaxID=70667 RepID=A0A183TLX5_SCHSO|nr:unnamed protein product [Schistocephalus solidus]
MHSSDLQFLISYSLPRSTSQGGLLTQIHVGSPCDEDVSGHKLQDSPLLSGNSTIICKVSTALCAAIPPPCLKVLTLGVELPTSWFSTASSGLEKDLASCSHIYLRCDQLRRPLKPLYDSTFRVVSRGTKTFHFQRGTREEVVTVKRFKAASELPCGSLPSSAPPTPPFIPSSCILPLTP